MHAPARMLTRSALVLAVVVSVSAAAALAPRRAAAQVPLGPCVLEPVSVVRPVVTFTGVVALQRVLVVREVCFATVISTATPLCHPAFFTAVGVVVQPGCVASAVTTLVPVVRRVFVLHCRPFVGCFAVPVGLGGFGF